MTNLIDRMDQLAEALKAAGDDIASRRVANARRDRIRGLITPAAADAAASTAEKRLVELGQEKAGVPNSLLGVQSPIVPALITTMPGMPRPPAGSAFEPIANVPGAVTPDPPAPRREPDPGADVRSESSAFAHRTPVADLSEKLGGVKVIIADELPGPRPFGQRGFVLRQGDPIPSKRCEYCGTHGAGYIANHGDDDGDRDLCACCYGEPYDPKECLGQGPCSSCGEEFAVVMRAADDGYLLNGAPHGIEAEEAAITEHEPPRKTTTTTVVHHPFRFRAEPYSGGGWHRPGLTFAELRRIVDELDRARMPDDHFIEVKTTDDYGHRPELLLTPGTWKVEQ